jgi:hypothetical protein
MGFHSKSTSAPPTIATAHINTAAPAPRPERLSTVERRVATNPPTAVVDTGTLRTDVHVNTEFCPSDPGGR